MEKPASQQTPRTALRKRVTTKDLLEAALLLVALVTTPTPAHPQGCAQCLDNTAATPPKTQAAYRHAIEFMTITAGSLFLGTLLVFKRYR